MRKTIQENRISDKEPFTLSRTSSGGFDGLFLAAMILPAIMVAARLMTGISMSPDSLAYLYAARNFFGTIGSIGFDGAPLTIFPPFYPFLIALVSVFSESIERAAIIISIGSIAGSAGTSYCLLRQFNFGRSTAFFLILLVFLHPQMQMVFWFAWSEVPYILLSLLVLLTLVRTRPNNIQVTAIFVGILVGLGFLTRYAGVVLLPTAIIGLICVANAPLNSRLRASALATWVGGFIILLWAVRNYFADGTFLGPRSDSADTLVTAAKHLASAVGGWVIPVGSFAGYWPYIGLAASLLSLLLVVIGRRSIQNSEMRLAPVLVFLLLHLGLLVYSQITTTIDPINSRLTSPAVIPALLVVALSIRALGQRVFVPGARRMIALSATPIVLGCALLSARWIGQSPWGYGVYNLALRDTPTYCQEAGRSVFASSPNYLRYLGIAPGAERLPRSEIYRANKRQNDWDNFIGKLNLGDACLIWLGRAGGETPSPRELLGGDPERVTVHFLLENGGVFFFRATISGDSVQLREKRLP